MRQQPRGRLADGVIETVPFIIQENLIPEQMPPQPEARQGGRHEREHEGQGPVLLQRRLHSQRLGQNQAAWQSSRSGGEKPSAEIGLTATNRRTSLGM